jgi:hypothetical protein
MFSMRLPLSWTLLIHEGTARHLAVRVVALAMECDDTERSRLCCWYRDLRIRRDERMSVACTAFVCPVSDYIGSPSGDRQNKPPTRNSVGSEVSHTASASSAAA